MPSDQHQPSHLSQLTADRRIPIMLVLGFSSGLPLLLVYGTQSAWLMDAKVSLATIGWMSELTLAYKIKFLWAPFLDRYDPPLLGHLLGRRRGWIVASQIGVMVTLIGIAFGDPAHWLWWTIAFSLALGFAATTQDITIDGWRINVVPIERQPLMSSWSEIGWRTGNLAAGAGALYLSQFYGWRVAYLCMAALVVPGMIAALLAPEPERDPHAHIDDLGIGQTIIAPIKELITRLGPMAAPILLMVAGFRMPGYVSTAMATPLFKSLHYSNADIATVTKLFGFGVALGGVFLASWLVPRIGMMASLLIGTVAGSASHLSLAWLAAHGDHGGGEFWLFAMSVSIESFAYSFASVVLITYMSSLTATSLAASQYALLTALCALPGSLLAMGSGVVIERIGFTWFFVGTSLIGIPVAMLVWWVGHQHARRMEPASVF